MNNNNLINYYVDESGDLTLFNKKGLPAIGTSRVFMLGLLKMKENCNFNENFESFKKQILADPIFQSFPSIEKTKIQFHAKDDHIAIKREVFRYVKELDFSVQVVIRRKTSLIEQAKTQFEYDKTKMTEKQIYGDLVKRLFKQNIHKVEHYNIYFANRGKTFTNNSLEEALLYTRKRFCERHNINSNSTFKVFCAKPDKIPGLQIIDYCLWALQRMYERNEDIYFNMISDKFKLIMDVDDKRKKDYGAYYNNQKSKISIKEIDGAS